MFRFAHPYYLLLIIPAISTLWFIYRKRIRHGIVFTPTSRLPASLPTWRTRVGNVLSALIITGLILAVTALARPQTILSTAHRSADVIAIEMVTDVSGSMEALDLSIKTPTGIKYRTRLDAVKETFIEFIKQRPDDLIGLITFGGYASTRSPLTTDHGALLHVLKGVEIPRPALDKAGRIINREETLTAIGDALATACARMENCETASKIIVLLSDGESNTGIIKPEQAIEAARKLGIKVYAIGVGSNGPAPFRARDMFGREVIQQAVVSLDETLLKKIAETTGGRYFNAQNPAGLERALEDINSLEKTKIDRDIYNQYNELFPRFLWPAIIIIMLGTSLNMMITRRIT